MERKHADQLSGYVWQELTGNVHRLTFKFLQAEVYWDGEARAFRYEIHGFRKLRSKDTYVSLPVAKGVALRKLLQVVQNEHNRIQATLDELIPF